MGLIGAILLGVFGGGLIVSLAVSTLYYRAIFKSSESARLQADTDRRDATKLANDAMDAKRAAEEGLETVKTYFKKHLETPLVATFTEEQLDNLITRLSGSIWNVGKPN